MRVGPWDLLALLDTTDSANVFLARASADNALLFLEVLKPSYASRAGHVERLFKKARAGASLSHPNIVRTVAFSQVTGVHCLATEYVSGAPLSEVTKQKQLPEPAALAVMTGVRAALEHAKAARFSGAVLLGFDGNVKLTGFEEGAPDAEALPRIARELGLDPANISSGDPTALAPFLGGIYGERIALRRAALQNPSDEAALIEALEAKPVQARELPTIPGGATNLDLLGVFSSKLRAPPAMTDIAPLRKR